MLAAAAADAGWCASSSSQPAHDRLLSVPGQHGAGRCGWLAGKKARTGVWTTWACYFSCYSGVIQLTEMTFGRLYPCTFGNALR